MTSKLQYNVTLNVISYALQHMLVTLLHRVYNTVGRILLKIIKREIVNETNRFENEQKRKIENIIQLKTLDADTNSENVIIEMTETNKNIALTSPRNNKK